MPDNLRYPQNAQTTSSEQSLGKGPKDMPDRGGAAPNAQVTSTQVPLSRTEHPVAHFGARPGQGQVQCTSTETPLSRSASMPYDSVNQTKPQVPFSGKGRK